MQLDKELIDKFKSINKFLEKNYMQNMDNNDLRIKLSQMGVVKPILVEACLHNENLLGVDGSLNSYGANYPHQLWVFRSLAKTTNGKQVTKSDILTPLDGDFRKQIDTFSKEKNISSYDGVSFFIKEKLAEMELDVAIEGIIKFNPTVVFMDGSLIRFKIECEQKWGVLKQLVLEKKILLAGIIEEIGTKNLGKHLDLGDIYDREIMFGLLHKGEQFKLDSQIKEGFITTFVRPGEDPQPVAVDCLLEQQENIDKIISLATSLTPQKGRGIPIWLDIVDTEVRITNKIVEGLVENYISPDLRYKLFVGKRKERWF